MDIPRILIDKLLEEEGRYMPKVIDRRHEEEGGYYVEYWSTNHIKRRVDICRILSNKLHEEESGYVPNTDRQIT